MSQAFLPYNDQVRPTKLAVYEVIVRSERTEDGEPIRVQGFAAFDPRCGVGGRFGRAHIFKEGAIGDRESCKYRYYDGRVDEWKASV